ncbi:DUF4886 domain-containing protein [Proteiniphilum sp. UBA5384]|uniref:DUF4886 domain-containing protein n=1 Tax=Proteiniphilum sp. UBA5384 TaxID=1947279 RepID=UPI0025E9CD43|nr:DUF4886 domain-containing protein [Proteiniphilum sp. UBA5384]
MKIINFCIYILILGTSNFACSGANDIPQIKKQIKEYVVNIDQTDISLKEGSKQLLTASFNEDAAQLDYSWNNSNPEIVGLENNNTDRVTIHGLSVGTAIVTLESAGKEVSVQCKITVTERGSVKLLALGNSFTVDAIEQNLYELAEAEGIELIIGSMTIGGGSLDRHWDNISDDKAEYNYLKIEEGNKTRVSDKAISSVIKEEDWDYISIQQVSGYSGLLSSYGNLSNILNYLRENAINPDVKFILHQTWAYAGNSTHADFSKYDRDQIKMYNSIVETTRLVTEKEGLDMIIPSGTAIQNARTSYIGDNFTRDGFHLDMSYGRYTAACVWFGKLFGIDVRNNSFMPAGLSESRANVARTAAYFAVQNPYKVTELVDFKEDPVIKELIKPVYVDFGEAGKLSSFPWNNMTSTIVGSSIELVDEDGAELGIELIIKQKFGGRNSGGPTVTQIPEFTLPETASNDSFFGNLTEFNGQTSPEGEIEIKGLNSERKYDFLFFSSRAAADNRETKYTVRGTNEKIVYLDASSNIAKVVGTQGIQPRSNGTVSINVTYGPNNNNEYKFFYINAMKLSVTE